MSDNPLRTVFQHSVKVFKKIRRINWVFFLVVTIFAQTISLHVFSGVAYKGSTPV